MNHERLAPGDLRVAVGCPARRMLRRPHLPSVECVRTEVLRLPELVLRERRPIEYKDGKLPDSRCVENWDGCLPTVCTYRDPAAVVGHSVLAHGNAGGVLHNGQAQVQRAQGKTFLRSNIDTTVE